MSGALAKAAGIEDPPPRPEPSSQPHDLETGLPVLKPSSSRASLPLHRQRTNSQPASVSGLPPTSSGAGIGPDPADGDTDDEYTWGPSHPCFPHPNPHVPLSSPLAESTRIIRVKRDWMVAGDLAPAFANLYPEVLDPVLSEEAFRQIIAHVNRELVDAFNPWGWRNWVDAVLGVATLWVWEDLGFTRVRGKLKALEEWIERWNREVGSKEGVRIIELRRTGYMNLDIQIPDPHIGIDTGASRPATSDFTPAPTIGPVPPPQGHGDFGPYPIGHIPDPSTLRSTGNQHLPPGVAVGGR
ncbi:hypothetical protein H2201_006416 [Coniosporium apollinis]|uniref:Ras modification protein ERF4 n=1 Tax=Coniosporium apollinis TaxID=61459 RepID=A0ABQ9NR76_9PEZI|nr:hypothetical protein H2201_006416 [Coniosporium apollinis]